MLNISDSSWVSIATSQCFTEFKAKVEKKTGFKIKALKSDNAKEYVEGKLTKYLRKEGIRFVPVYPCTPEDNLVAERMNRTLCESARCMLIQSGLPKCLWLYAIGHAALCEIVVQQGHCLAMQFLLNFSLAKKQVLKCFMSLDQVVFTNRKV